MEHLEKAEGVEKRHSKLFYATAALLQLSLQELHQVGEKRFQQYVHLNTKDTTLEEPFCCYSLNSTFEFGCKLDEML